MSGRFDVVIIGGGAAGLAARERLRRAPHLEVVLIEAQEALGGRARTLEIEGLPLDAGCGWLHSADKNALAPRLEAAGIAIDRTPASWSRQSEGEGSDERTRASFAAAFQAFDARLEAAFRKGLEGAASDHLEPGCAWNPRLDAVSTFYNGCELAEVSVLDYGAYEDTGLNWRVRDGYGSGLLKLLGSAGARLGVTAQRVDRSGRELEVHTNAGVLRTRTVILAVPSTVLARGEIMFSPGLPEKVEAAAALPLGLANKAFLALARPERFAPEEHVLGRIHEVRTGGYHIRPFARPYVEAFFGGRYAEELEDAGAGALAAAAVDELVSALGSEIRRELRPLAETGWRHEPFIRGAYSHALPGASDARGRLAAPVEQRIFFAGEATHATFFSTAHGAYETGARAADEAIAAISPP